MFSFVRGGTGFSVFAGCTGSGTLNENAGAEGFFTGGASVSFGAEGIVHDGIDDDIGSTVVFVGRGVSLRSVGAVVFALAEKALDVLDDEGTAKADCDDAVAGFEVVVVVPRYFDRIEV